MHDVVSKNVSEYIEKNVSLRPFFERLIGAGKKLFLVTNSPYHFVNKGMIMLAGADWRDCFDVVIVQARKPRFFTDESRPIRLFDQTSGTHLWDRVVKLEKGKVYYEVNWERGSNCNIWGHY